MTDPFDAAIEVMDWLASAPEPARVATRILVAERDAFLWHVVSLHLTADELARFALLAEALKAGGYKVSP